MGRKSEHRRSLFRTLVTELLDKGRITTTVCRAKEIRPLAEKMITLGKEGTLHARRQALTFVRKNEVVRKLFSDVAPRFADRNGGYTRIIKLGYRKGDGSDMAIIEFIDTVFKPKEKKKKEKSEPPLS